MEEMKVVSGGSGSEKREEREGLSECMLWVIESIRQGTPPSLGCKMVLAR